MTNINYPYDGEDKIKDLLVGRKVVSVEQKGEKGYATLDNGTVLELQGNYGCGGCTSGWYQLDSLNRVDNVITAVEVTSFEKDSGEEVTEEWYDYPQVYKIFVYAENEKIEFATFEGDDGNGYYGTGFDIFVKGIE